MIVDHSHVSHELPGNVSDRRVRPVVLLLVQHYVPGVRAGGPIRSIRNLVAALAEEFEFHIHTTNRDFGCREAYATIVSNRWIDRGDYRIFYSDRAGVGVRTLRQLMAQVHPDVVHVNSFMSPGYSIAPLVARSWAGVGLQAAWVVAPRGEFAPGALAIKANKKRAYIGLARWLRLHHDVVWHATGEREAEDIRRAYGVPASDIFVAPNITEQVGDAALPMVARGPEDRLEICFLGRVTPMKNVAFAVDALTRVGHEATFHVYGPIEDKAYAAECDRIAARANGRVVVEWHGEVPHDRVRTVLTGNDLLLLPTHGENFGHAVFEALAAGLPVLVSDQTPWRDLDTRGVGWVRPLGDPQVFADVIDSFAKSPSDQRLAMRHRAHAYARGIASASEPVDATRRLLYDALQRRRGRV